jgi:hypothetical protein
MDGVALMLMPAVRGIISGSGGGSFVPSDLPGLILWTDVSDTDTLFQDSGKTTPVTANDDPVGAWADKSGEGNDVIQATASARPLYKTTYIDSDGAGDFLSSSSILIPDEVMVGVHLTVNDSFATQTNGYVSRGSSSASGSPYFLVTEGTGIIQIFIDGGYRFSHSMSTGETVRIVVRVTKPSTNYLVDCWFDGVKQTQYDAGTALSFVGSTFAWYLFSGYPGTGDANIPRFVYYEGTYDDTDAENIDSYLENG